MSSGIFFRKSGFDVSLSNGMGTMRNRGEEIKFSYDIFSGEVFTMKVPLEIRRAVQNHIQSSKRNRKRKRR